MYEAYFGLEKRPFAATPDVSCAYLPEPVQEVLSELLLRVEAGEGIALLTAPAGTGKTLLCRKLANEIAGRLPTIYLPSANFPTRRALFQAILYELGVSYSGLDEQELRLALQSQLKERAHQGKSLLLILDEAHLLNTRLLEEVRSLADLSENGRPLIRILLSGQLALEERLTGPELDALNQRLSCHVFLEPFTQTQVREYVAHRVAWAGGGPQGLFTADAVDLIAHGSNGLPRCINQLCDHSMLLAFVAESPEVTRTLVEDALQDLKQLPLHWNDTLPAAGPLDSLRRNSGNPVEMASPVAPAIPEVSVHTDVTPSPETLGDAFAFEIGAEPEGYPLVEITSPSAPIAAASERTPSEIAPSDQDEPLYQPRASFPGPLASFDSFETTPTIPLNRFQSEDAAEQTEDWEPVVEDHANTGLGSMAEIPRTLPPARRGVVPLLDLSVPRFSGFQEEHVVDPYARIDAGISGRPGNSLSTPQFNPAANLPRESDILPGIPCSAGETPMPLDASSLQRLPPDRLIERLIPLLDENADVEAPLSLLPAQPASSMNADSRDSNRDQEEPEETIGGEVLDLCLEVQDYFAREMNEPAPSTSRREERDEVLEAEAYQAIQEFDVIEPEPEPAQAPPTASRLHLDTGHTSLEKGEATGPLVPRPNYRRIFSMLRRKLRR